MWAFVRKFGLKCKIVDFFFLPQARRDRILVLVPVVCAEFAGRSL